MKDQIRELRVHIDGLHQLTHGLDCNQDDPSMIAAGQRMKWKSDQVKKASDSLLMSKYWLGRGLEVMKVEVTPDVAAIVKSLPDVTKVPVASQIDKITIAGYNISEWGAKSHPEKVTWLIKEITRVIDTYRSNWYDEHGYSTGFLYSVVHQHLFESTFWLEEELKRIEHEQV